MVKWSLLGGSALRSAALVALVATPFSSALAQDASELETNEAAQTLPDISDEDAGQEEEAIVVTGSRIRQNESTSASPLLIIDPVIAQRQGRFDTAEIIQNSPIASGSTQVTSALSANAVSNGGPGAQTVSLRGLGAERTLVLLNSRRAGPAGTRGAVSSFDLNVLPSGVIKSIEVLKDGASSIYGSDAVAGVVNLITKTDTDGLELRASSVPTIKGGGEEYNVSATWGKDFGGGHILIAGDYYRRNEMERQDRGFLDCANDYYFRSETSNERSDLIDPRTGEYTCDGAPWGHIWTYGAGNLPDDGSGVVLMQYNYPGDNLGALIPGPGPAVAPGDVVVPQGWFPVGYQSPNPVPVAVMNSYHPFEKKASVFPETDRYTLYIDGALDVTDGIEVYAEGIYNRRRTYVDSYSQIYNFGYTDMYAPGDADDPFPGWSGIGFPAYLSPTGIVDDYDQEITVDYYRAVAGVRGEISGSWRFDVYGQYSKSDGEYALQQILQDAISQQTARAYGYGCAGLFTPISNRACVQVNWTDPDFMAGNLSQAEKDYFFDTEIGRTEYIQKFVEASVSGDLPDLWGAGNIGVALGGVIRRDEIDDMPGHITMALVPGGDPNDPDDYVDNAFSNDFSSGHTFGHTTTSELFAEVSLPLIKDAPFFQSFTLSGAGRLTNVKAVRGDGASDSSNGNWTYKAMANWQVNDWVRFRATYGTSYRAPALFEQFLAGQVSGARQTIDPCWRWGSQLANGAITQRVADNCDSDGIPSNHTGAGIPIQVFTSGGLGNLEPETSKAKTASIILTPRFAGLPDTDIALTVDYFDITVNGEITLLDNADILYGCYNSDNFPNDPRCAYFERGQDGNPNNIRTITRQYINIDEQVNRGFDFTLRVRQDLGDLGQVSLLGQATLQTKDTVIRQGEFDDLNGDVADPKFTATVNLSWDIDDTSLFWGMNIIGAQDSTEDFLELNGVLCNVSPAAVQYLGDYCVRPYVPSVVYHNVSVTQTVQDRFEFTLGVANLLDTDPPEASGVTKFGNVPFYATQYDWLGRRLFASVRAKF